jgi:glyoxylase-like metal-dependent hydrolase (beta-lactamase superfamily II)
MRDMRITNLAEGSTEFTSNAFLVEGERDALVDAGNDDVVLERLRERGDPEAVVLTHTHADHVGVLNDIVEEFGAEVWGYDGPSVYVDHEFGEGETVRMGDAEFEIWHTPGHKNDHVCLYSRAEGVLFAGDLVFSGGSFGRTDLDEGDRETLVESIEKVIEHTDEINEMHTGHGPSVRENVKKHVEASLRNAQRY